MSGRLLAQNIRFYGNANWWYRYCPLGRGVLSSSVKTIEDIPEGDYRRFFPRYQPENLATNRKLVEEVEKMAEKKGCTTAQVSLGWLLALSKRDGMPTIIPIPGSSKFYV